MSLTPADWHHRYTEQARWTADLRRYLLAQALIQPPERVLEVGCGTGAVLADLPLPAPPAPAPRREGRINFPSPPGRGVRGEGIFGIDISLPSLLLARQNVPDAALACADAHHLPFPTASFDLVIAHFLLLWVADPRRVLCEMARLTRPGGAVLALAEPDYGGRVDYPPELAQVGAWQTASLQAQGADPYTGRKLASLFAAAGLADVQVGVLGGQWQPQTYDRAAFESEWRVIEADLETLPGASIPPVEITRLHHLDEDTRQRGERILFVPTFYAWGVAR